MSWFVIFDALVDVTSELWALHFFLFFIFWTRSCPGWPQTPNPPAPIPTGAQAASTLTLIKVILSAHNLHCVVRHCRAHNWFTGSWLAGSHTSSPLAIAVQKDIYRITFSNLILKQVCQEPKHSIFLFILERGQPWGKACAPIPLPVASIHMRSLTYKFIAHQVLSKNEDCRHIITLLHVLKQFS